MQVRRSLILMLLAVVTLSLTGCGGGGGGGGGGGSPAAPVNEPAENNQVFDQQVKRSIGFTDLKNAFTTKSFTASIRANGGIRAAVETYNPATGMWTINTINPRTGNVVTIYAKIYIGTSRQLDEGVVQQQITDATTKIEYVYTEYSLVNGNSVAVESVGQIIKTGATSFVYNEFGTGKVNGLIVVSAETSDITLSSSSAYPTGGSLTIAISGEGSATCTFNGTQLVPVRVTRLAGTVETFNLTL